MRIDRLELQNFRCFDHFELDLHPEFNVLIGENGAGKSAVLDALALGLSYWVGSVGGYEPRSKTVAKRDIRAVGRDVNGEYVFEPQEPSVVRLSTHILDKPFSVVKAYPPVREDSSEKGLLHFAIETQWRVRDEGDDGSYTLLPVATYYGTNRLWLPAEPESSLRRPMSSDELSRVRAYQGSLKHRRDPNELLRWMERQARIAFQHGTESKVYRAVREAMRRMMQGATDVRFDNRTLEVAILFGDGVVQTFPQLSDGQRNMLSLAGDLAMRMARLNPQLGENVLAETPGVVLIDELDLHLHPRWQRHVVSDLRRTFPKVQFVTTTHSPLILSEVEPECITVLTKAGDSFSAYKPSQSYGLDVDDLLLRLMGTRARPEFVQSLIDTIDDALEEGEFGLARDRVDELRERIHGDDPEVVRLDTSIYALEALSNAVD